MRAVRLRRTPALKLLPHDRRTTLVAQLWWIVHKDLLTEWRARQIGPAMLLLGGVVAFLFSLQLQVVPQALANLIGSQYWLTVFLGSLIALDGSFLAERDAAAGWRMFPVAPSLVFVAKLIGNAIALGTLQLVLALLFSALAGIHAFENLWALLLLGLTGNLAVVSLGTLLAAISCSMRKERTLLGVLMLPLEIPVVVAAAEATRLVLVGELGDAWWRWIQLLIAFAVIFTTAGAVLYGFVIED
jgi:heme exporter protein B